MDIINANHKPDPFSDILDNYDEQFKPSFVACDEVNDLAKAQIDTEITEESAMRVGEDIDALEDYKKKIYDKISSLSIHSSQLGHSYTIQITNEGFESMKNNTEYERFVIEKIDASFKYAFPCADAGYSVLVFGADQSKCFGLTKSIPIDQISPGSKELWERRAKIKRLYDQNTWERLQRKQSSRKQYKS